MDDDKLHNQIPIFRFLNKHKWRFVISILIVGYYLGIPRSSNVPQPIYDQLSIRSAESGSLKSINQQVANVADEIKSDESMLAIAAKCDLFSEDRKNGISNSDLLEKVRWRVSVEQQINSPEGEAVIYIASRFVGDDSQKNQAVMKEIESRFQMRPDFDVSKPKHIINLMPSWRMQLTWLGINGFFFSLMLILIWEIPNLFYSRKTQEMVFDPIRADWGEELLEAKVHGSIMDRLLVNLRYSIAFVGAVLAKSPIGELFELVGKVAR